jgi:hypothetical protein
MNDAKITPALGRMIKEQGKPLLSYFDAAALTQNSFTTGNPNLFQINTAASLGTGGSP